MSNDNIDTNNQSIEPTQPTEKSQIKKKTPGVIVVADLGGSQTKVIFHDYPSSEPQTFCLGSEIADANIDTLRGKVFSVGDRPEDNCWVGLPNDGGYAFGHLAANDFRGIPMLRTLKFDLAVPKIAGILWVVSQKLKKKKTSPLQVSLFVLLPPSEGRKGEDLKKKLELELVDFDTPTGKLTVELLKFQVVREGYGVGIYHGDKLGEEFAKSNISVVMGGYRNLSVLSYTRGKVQDGASCELGMHWLIKDFVKESSAGFDADNFNIVEILTFAGDDCDASILSKLSRKQKVEERKVDGDNFAITMRKSRESYVNAVTRWLSEKIPDGIDEVILCGGTAKYIKEELTEYFEDKEIAITWDGGIVIPSVLDKCGMGERLADAYGLYYSYIQTLEKKKKGEKSWSNWLDQMVVTSKKEAKEKARRSTIIDKVKSLVDDGKICFSASTEYEVKRIVVENPWLLDELPLINRKFPNIVKELN